MRSRFLAVAALGFWSTAVLADTSSIYSANDQVGGELLMRRINYTETAQGSTLDTEQGNVPGVGAFASLMYGPHNGYLAAEYEGFKGTTNYTGAYIGGGGYGSVVGKSGAKVTDFSVRDGLGIIMNPELMLTPYLTLGYHQWDRNVGDGAPGGYGETYSHMYYGLGLRAQYSPVNRLVFLGRVMIGHTDAARISIPTFGVSMSLKSAGMYQLGMGADYALTDHLHLQARLAYTSWRYGASDVQPGGLYEPDSQTNDTTLKVGLGYGF